MIAELARELLQRKVTGRVFLNCWYGLCLLCSYRSDKTTHQCFKVGVYSSRGILILCRTLWHLVNLISIPQWILGIAVFCRVLEKFLDPLHELGPYINFGQMCAPMFFFSHLILWWRNSSTITPLKHGRDWLLIWADLMRRVRVHILLPLLMCHSTLHNRMGM